MIVAPRESFRWLEDLNRIAHKGSELISTRGWVQDQMVGANGQLCIVSAGHEAARETEIPGLSHVLREVLDYLGRAEGWNDDEFRYKSDVTTYLRQHQTTREVMEGTFGPQWELICYLTALFGSMSKEELENWNDGKDQVEDYAELRQRNLLREPDLHLIRARTAVSAAYIDRCEALNVQILAPSVSLYVTKIFDPTLAS